MLIQVMLSSLTAGSVYALVALGFVLIYKGTGVVHFGYGDQITLGAYMVIIGQSLMHLPFGLALIAALAVSALIGVLIFLIFSRPLRHATLWTRIIATLAIGIALREGLRAFMGPTSWPFPFLLSQQAIEMAGIYITPGNLAITATAVIILATLFLFLEKTLRGKAILAACENRIGASLIGVRVAGVHLTIWVLASVLAAVAGILVAPLLTLSPDMGTVAIKGFTAAVIGGFASLPGAVVGGILLGLLEGLAGTYISSAMKDVVSYATLFLVMLVMPHGLFGKNAIKKV